MFTALRSGNITLHLINEDDKAAVYAMFEGLPGAADIIEELTEYYLPKFEDGMRTTYGFYTMLDDELAGLSLLTIDDWRQRTGSTGADALPNMRGKGITLGSKPHLFYLAFELLGLNRLETGCLVSNVSSKRSIEKTPGFQFEGVARESGLTEDGRFEDQYIYAIIKKDWERLYDKTLVEVIY